MICIKRGGSAWKRGDGPRGAWQNDLMFIDFLAALRAAKVPVTLREYLTLMAAMDRDLAMKSVEDFYVLSRTILVKDERNFDRFDRVFATVFRGLSAAADQAEPVDVPADWLRALVEANLSEAERLQIAALGFDRLLETLRQRLREQNSRHQGGSKWIGTAGISPFGGAGYHPEGVRMGLERGRQKRAVRLWERREFRDLDSGVELGTRTMKLALRRLRKFARTGAREELDLPATIQATAERGYLDIRLRPERRNAVKVLLFFDAVAGAAWRGLPKARLAQPSARGPLGAYPFDRADRPADGRANVSADTCRTRWRDARACPLGAPSRARPRPSIWRDEPRFWRWSLGGRSTLPADASQSR